MIHDTQGAQISQKQDDRNIYIYVIMKTMCPPGYHHNGFVFMITYIYIYNIYIYICIYIFDKKTFKMSAHTLKRRFTIYLCHQFTTLSIKIF